MLPHCDAFKCLPPSVVFYFLILQENRLEKNSTITHDETFLWLWKPDINKLELFAYWIKLFVIMFLYSKMLNMQMISLKCPESYFQLFPYSQEVTTEGSSTCLIYPIFLFLFFYSRCSFWHKPKGIFVSSWEKKKCKPPHYEATMRFLFLLKCTNLHKW